MDPKYGTPNFRKLPSRNVRSGEESEVHLPKAAWAEHAWYGVWVYLPLVSREWRNGVQL